MLTWKFPLYICLCGLPATTTITIRSWKNKPSKATPYLSFTTFASSAALASCLRCVYAIFFRVWPQPKSTHPEKQWKATSGIRFSFSRSLFQKHNNLLILFSIRLTATSCCCCCCFYSHFWHLVWMELRFCHADNFGVYYRHLWWCYIYLFLSHSLILKVGVF